MSETEPAPSASAQASTGDTPRVRRISNPRPKKSARKMNPDDQASQGVVPPSAPPYPVFDLSAAPAEQPADAASASGGDWPEPEPPSAGNASPQEGSKRKRRRKKGKGGGQQMVAQAAGSESAPEAEAEVPVPQPPAPQSRPSPQPRTKADPEKVAKLALKIYLAEVSEEGVALIGDNDAKELSRRCFRLAEIFIEEESRRR